MEIKLYLKSQFGLKHSGDYFNISAPPINTCPWIDDVKIKVKSLKIDPEDQESIAFVKNFLEVLEDFRASCDSIRKEVQICKSQLWSFIDEVYQIDPQTQTIKFDESAEADFMSWTLEPYTEAETNRLDKLAAQFQSKVELQINLPEFEEIFMNDLRNIKSNIFNLDSWRKEYFSLVNERKDSILSAINYDLNKLNLKKINH